MIWLVLLPYMHQALCFFTHATYLGRRRLAQQTARGLGNFLWHGITDLLLYGRMNFQLTVELTEKLLAACDLNSVH